MSPIEPTDGGVLIRIKAVPGAKREQIAGRLGDRLKVKVSAPPEAGKANKAICAIIAKQLAVKSAAVEVIKGMSNPEKTIRVLGISAEVARDRLGLGEESA
ncbi:MAG TPA: YggU family protein [Phycisphaerales bacterium]|nr:YggU family protein [Phycisphaerales bacterium]